MVKKKPDPKEHPCKGSCNCTKEHNKEYQKKHEKEHFPRKIWPTDSENKKKKGPKI
jgi:hypothetical protein